MNFEITKNLLSRYSGEPTNNARIIAMIGNKIADIVEFDMATLSIADAKDILIERQDKWG